MVDKTQNFVYIRACLFYVCKLFCLLLVLGIFERHKLLFSLQITIKVQQNANEIKQAEIDFFIKVTNFIHTLCLFGNDFFLLHTNI